MRYMRNKGYDYKHTFKGNNSVIFLIRYLWDRNASKPFSLIDNGWTFTIVNISLLHACLFIPILVQNFTYLFNCTTVARA